MNANIRLAMVETLPGVFDNYCPVCNRLNRVRSTDNGLVLSYNCNHYVGINRNKVNTGIVYNVPVCLAK